MPSLDGLLIVVAAGFAAPFLLGLAPGLRIPGAGLISVLLFPAAALALLQARAVGRFAPT